MMGSLLIQQGILPDQQTLVHTNLNPTSLFSKHLVYHTDSADPWLQEKACEEKTDMQLV